MTVLRAARLSLSFDAARLQSELQALAEPWEPHMNRGYYEGDWSGIAFRSNSLPHQRKIFIDPSRPEDFVDTDALSRCPYMRESLAAFPCSRRAVRLLKLAPGAVIREHRDVGICIDEEEARLHIPILTNDRTDFIVGGERVSMQPGECWYVNVDLPHSVVNGGETDRVHLVVDVAVDEWLRGTVRESRAAS